MTIGRNAKPNGVVDNSDSPTTLNILLVGEEAAGIQVLRILSASPHHVVAVASTPSENSQVSTLWNVAGKMKIERLSAQLVKQSQFSKYVSENQVDLILNVHSLYLMDVDVINACRIGAYNMHPGPLPEYAGLNVPSWAIYRGETEHAVTIHQMVSRIDAGTIAYEQRFPIEADDNGMTLMSKCVRAGVPLIRKLLHDAAAGVDQIPKVTQDLNRRQFFRGQAPNEGELCWHRPAKDIINHVRAADYSPFMSPWGNPANIIEGRKFGIVRAKATKLPADAPPGTVGKQHESGFYVAAKDHWVLVETLTIDGKTLGAQEILKTDQRLDEENCSHHP